LRHKSGKHLEQLGDSSEKPKVCHAPDITRSETAGAMILAQQSTARVEGSYRSFRDTLPKSRDKSGGYGRRRKK
jgi:hypothetical protein